MWGRKTKQCLSFRCQNILKQTNKKAKQSMPCNEGNLWIFLTIHEALCGSPLARMSSERLNCPFSKTTSWSVQDLIRPRVGWSRRPSRAPYWFESSSCLKTVASCVKPSLVLCCKGLGMAGFMELPSFADIGI